MFWFLQKNVLRYCNNKNISVLSACLICNQNNCDLETTVRDWRHSRITIGKHSKCVWTPIKEICNGNP